MDIGEILARKQRKTKTVTVLLDDGLAAERDRLVVQVAVAERQDEWESRVPEAPGLRERLREVENLIVESQVPFTFQAMPRTKWNELVDAFTDEDTDELFVEGFGPEIMAASSLDPKMTVDDVLALWDEWSSAETEQLYIAAYKVNREVRDIPFTPAGIEPTPITGSNSTTADQDE